MIAGFPYIMTDAYMWRGNRFSSIFHQKQTFFSTLSKQFLLFLLSEPLNLPQNPQVYLVTYRIIKYEMAHLFKNSRFYFFYLKCILLMILPDSLVLACPMLCQLPLCFGLLVVQSQTLKNVIFGLRDCLRLMIFTLFCVFTGQIIHWSGKSQEI